MATPAALAAIRDIPRDVEELSSAVVDKVEETLKDVIHPGIIPQGVSVALETMQTMLKGGFVDDRKYFVRRQDTPSTLLPRLEKTSTINTLCPNVGGEDCATCCVSSQRLGETVSLDRAVRRQSLAESAASSYLLPRPRVPLPHCGWF